MTYDKCLELLETFFKANRCEAEGNPESERNMKEWAFAWRAVGVITLGEYCKVCDLIDAHFNPPPPPEPKPKRKPRKPFAIVREEYEGAGLTPDALSETARKLGCEVKDLFGKRLAFKRRVGKRRKLSSLRVFDLQYVSMCDCCGPSPRWHYRLGKQEVHELRGWSKTTTPTG